MSQETPGSTPPPPPPPPPGQPAGPVPDYASPASTGTGYPNDRPVPENQDAKTMAMLCHLLAIVTGFLGPLIIWLLKKDSSKFVDDQGKEALNFWITVSIILVICSVTAFLCIPALIAIVVWIVGIVFAIMGAMKANQGIAYRYPVNIRLIK